MPTIMLTPHFSLQEFCYSETASRQGISNIPGGPELENLSILAKTMEKVRTICGNHPVTITSGYRCPEVNAACGGSDNSAHMSGLAADFIIPGCGDPLDVCKLLEPHLEELQIDQLIHEYGDWVHLGLTRGDARCACLTIDSGGTSTGFA